MRSQSVMSTVGEAANRPRVHCTFASATLSGGRWRLASFWNALPMFEEEDATTVRKIARKSAMGTK